MTLPYIATDSVFFLIFKIIIFSTICFFIVKYLKTWISIRQYILEKEKWIKARKNLGSDKEVDFKKPNETLDKVKEDLNFIKKKAKQKAGQYKNFKEYVKYDKVDFIELDETINSDVENNLNTIKLLLSFRIGILEKRIIPKEQK